MLGLLRVVECDAPRRTGSQSTMVASSLLLSALSPRSCHFSNSCKSLATFRLAPRAGWNGLLPIRLEGRGTYLCHADSCYCLPWCLEPADKRIRGKEGFIPITIVGEALGVKTVQGRQNSFDGLGGYGHDCDRLRC